MVAIGLRVLLLSLMGVLFAPLSAIAESDTGGVIVSKEMKLNANQWRFDENEYVICPGEYRTYLGVLKCRVSVGGFSGFAGEMKDAKTLTALTIDELATNTQVPFEEQPPKIISETPEPEPPKPGKRKIILD